MHSFSHNVHGVGPNYYRYVNGVIFKRIVSNQNEMQLIFHDW